MRPEFNERHPLKYIFYANIPRKEEADDRQRCLHDFTGIDLLASLFVPVLTIHDFLSNLRWLFGSVMCKMLPYIPPISHAASFLPLVLIAADRYR